jgi:hypothetical protein
MKKVSDGISEMVIEEGWRISRKLMKEIEDELECKGELPIDMLLASTNLQIKWIGYSRCN